MVLIWGEPGVDAPYDSVYGCVKLLGQDPNFENERLIQELFRVN